MNDADIQVLASLRRAEVKEESSDRESLEGSADRYLKYLENWSGSWQRLLSNGLIEGDESQYSLTARGRPLAEAYYAERPDYFWYYYQSYYPAARASIAHSRLCRRVFGKDLTQDGQADMESVNDLIAYLEISESDRVLDLGCGAGGLAEYVSDETGAHVTGLDYAATAIETGAIRSSGKSDRLTFVQGDMNSLDFAELSFDKVVLIDTIYWVADIDKTLASLVRLIKPGGRIGIFVSITPAINATPNTFEPDSNWIAMALKKRELDYDVHDYTDGFLKFWPKLRQVALELRDDFVAEGNEAILESYMVDADGDYLPAAAAGKLRRYLYIAKV